MINAEADADPALMPTLTDAANFATDNAVRPVVIAAMVGAAVSIMNEDPTTAKHDQRIALAKLVLNVAEQVVPRFAWAISTNPTIVTEHAAGDETALENDLPYVISTIWDALADSI